MSLSSALSILRDATDEAQRLDAEQREVLERFSSKGEPGEPNQVEGLLTRRTTLVAGLLERVSAELPSDHPMIAHVRTVSRMAQDLLDAEYSYGEMACLLQSPGEGRDAPDHLEKILLEFTSQD